MSDQAKTNADIVCSNEGSIVLFLPTSEAGR